MNINILKHTGRLLLLVAIQVFILNQIYFGGYITPFVYPLFILLLPFDVKGWVLLLSAFLSGLAVDMFSDSMGLHASASLFMAFARPGVIKLISIKTDFDQGTEPSISLNGFSWILLYTSILIILHHLFLFMVETFRFDQIHQVMIKTLLSSIPSVFIIVLSLLLTGGSARRRS